MIKGFNKRFGIEESLQEEQTRFVQRINQTIFENIQEGHGYKKVFKTVCYWLGENADDRISAHNRYNYGLEIGVPTLRTLTNDDFV